MKRLLILLLMLGCAPAMGQAFLPVGFQQISSLSGAATLTVPNGANQALICAETSAVRWRDDGTAPTASVGSPLAAGQCFLYSGSLGKIQIIQQTSGALIDVSYYR